MDSRTYPYSRHSERTTAPLKHCWWRVKLTRPGVPQRVKVRARDYLGAGDSGHTLTADEATFIKHRCQLRDNSDEQDYHYLSYGIDQRR